MSCRKRQAHVSQLLWPAGSEDPKKGKLVLLSTLRTAGSLRASPRCFSAICKSKGWHATLVSSYVLNSESIIQTCLRNILSFFAYHPCGEQDSFVPTLSPGLYAAWQLVFLTQLAQFCCCDLCNLHIPMKVLTWDVFGQHEQGWHQTPGRMIGMKENTGIQVGFVHTCPLVKSNHLAMTKRIKNVHAIELGFPTVELTNR